jgi:hypothetical protein
VIQAWVEGGESIISIATAIHRAIYRDEYYFPNIYVHMSNIATGGELHTSNNKMMHIKINITHQSLYNY